MFEKEAEEYAIENYENCLYDDFPYTNDSKAIERSFKNGAEFGYNKANDKVSFLSIPKNKEKEQDLGLKGLLHPSKTPNNKFNYERNRHQESHNR